MTQDSIRVGIIGAGANTRDRHIPGLQAIDGVEIVAVCNRSQASGERVGSVSASSASAPTGRISWTRRTSTRS